MADEVPRVTLRRHDGAPWQHAVRPAGEVAASTGAVREDGVPGGGRAAGGAAYAGTGPEVTLSVVNGPAAGRQFTFAERTTCVVGRASDCWPRLPHDDRRAARHQFLIDINPPDVRIRDFGTAHGTFVNGEEIGKHAPGPVPGRSGTLFAERDLSDGDEVRAGATLLRVGIPPAGRAAPSRVPCAHCGQRSAPRRGRWGDAVCATCRGRPLSVLRGLLARADEDDTLARLRGYEVVREFGGGGGGLGAVYLARHRGTGAYTALKVLLAEVAVDRRARAGFLGEIARAGGLRHRNILGFGGAAARGAAFCLAFEYCPGGTLQDLLDARGGTLPPHEAVSMTLQILDGLAYAHGYAPGPKPGSAGGRQRALVHGDVKPSNILLAWDGDGSGEPRGAVHGAGAGGGRCGPPTVKIGDFGLAQAFDRAGLSGLTRTGPLTGTVGHLPRAQLVDYTGARPETDVWAAAATLYRMLTGSAPRDFPPGADPVMVLLREPAVPVRQRNAAVPRRLAQVIDAALIDNPRIVTTRADEFRAALSQTLS